jgi:hypothetical protein
MIPKEFKGSKKKMRRKKFLDRQAKRADNCNKGMERYQVETLDDMAKIMGVKLGPKEFEYRR